MMAAHLNHPIRRLLVANRGEIACRIMRTAKRMNIETVAVFSAADRNAMHVKLADEAYYVGPAEPLRSYLNQDKILEIAHKRQAVAIHPGYGFLSENAEFSQRCQDEQLVFVGPNAKAIRTMGIKNESKRIMIEAGVPVVPGYHGIEQDNDLLLNEARKIGYPVLIKPVRGGGGKGMRIVHKEEDFIEALESSRRESLKSFNDQSMLLEKYIQRPRHVEVQIFGDKFGNYVYLYERDCSVQRRHQKIIEEAPAPLLSEAKREDLGNKAVAAARAVDYIGAGTVEFILDKETGEFFFMEMNTRLQVEHPITEMITGTDLVDWQLRVAGGEKLPKTQSELTPNGHAFEARIYAEDPRDNFLPQTGQLKYIRLPDNSTLNSHSTSPIDLQRVRLDTGVTSGDTISPYYDPMIAKLVVWSEDRSSALSKLDKALQQYIVVGVPTNIQFLSSLATNESFKAADVGTDFIDLHQDELFQSKSQTLDETKALAEICVCIYKLVSQCTADNLSDSLVAFRMIGLAKPKYEFDVQLDEQNVHVVYEPTSHNSGNLSVSSLDNPTQKSSRTPIRVELQEGGVTSIILGGDEESEAFRFSSIEEEVLTDTIDGKTMVVLRNSADQNRVFQVKYDCVFQKRTPSGSTSAGSDPLLACAPMPGIVEKVLVSVGDEVEKDQSLVVLSAMKMEYTIKSNMNGKIEAVNHKAGDFVAKDSVLVKLIKS